VFNLSHAGLLTAALAFGRIDLLRTAIDDKLHQPYRIPVIPDFETVQEVLLAAGADAVALSGAGPTIIAFVSGFDVDEALMNAQQIVEATTKPILSLGTRLAPIPLPFSDSGAIQHDGFGQFS
jgi:homoserine kinase